MSKPTDRTTAQASAPAVLYVRERDLGILLRLWPSEAMQLAREDHPALLRRLAAALRAERRRGQTRAWSYDIVRHRALLRAYRAELLAGGRGPT
jgi:hypothetical protein